jgi:hypothetical protein
VFGFLGVIMGEDKVDGLGCGKNVAFCSVGPLVSFDGKRNRRFVNVNDLKT